MRRPSRASSNRRSGHALSAAASIASAAAAGFHFLVSYEPTDAAATEPAHALASALGRAGAEVWLDAYRLENGHSIKQAAYCAARDAAFVLLLVTPRSVASPTRCLELLAALRRPREHVLVWVVPTSEWARGGGGPDTAQRVEAWFRAHGFRLVRAT